LLVNFGIPWNAMEERFECILEYLHRWGILFGFRSIFDVDDLRYVIVENVGRRALVFVG